MRKEGRRLVTGLPGAIVIAISYLVGGIPFSGLVARRLEGVDLRTVGTGTVSGSGLYRVAGAGPVIAGGSLDLVKGTVGPWLAGPDRPHLQAAAGTATVVGHNWSPFLGGAGGRGISPAMGALLVQAPEGSALMLAGLIAGKVADATSLGAFASFLGLIVLLGRTRGSRGRLTALALVAPMLVKRMAGNRPPPEGAKAWIRLVRLVFDQDSPQWPRWPRADTGGRS